MLAASCLHHISRSDAPIGLLVDDEFFRLSSQSACDDNSDTSSSDDDVDGTPAKRLRSRTHSSEHSVAAATAISDEEELYSDLEAGNEEWTKSAQFVDHGDQLGGLMET